ncbi:MAG TPA: tRNA (adenosine(37)-N6)-dimethylallyltransferase MiaA [Candidatus Dormibacteraeota bacterium]
MLRSADGYPPELPGILAIMGPTASGKTALAVGVARQLEAELVNADSRQAIAELSIGVCKPTAQQLQGIPIHGLAWSHLGQPFSVADYVALAAAAVADIAARGHLPVVVGGTGLYLRALLHGFDFGGVPPEPTRRLEALSSVAAERDLRHLDPARASRLDRRNPRRVARALELARARAQPQQRPLSPRALKVACAVGHEQLRERIRARAEELLGGPLLEEIEGLLAGGASPAVIARSAIGYAEALDWLGGSCQRQEAVERVVLRTWRYARAQLTWLRSEPDLAWLDMGSSVEGWVTQCLSLVGKQGLLG